MITSQSCRDDQGLIESSIILLHLEKCSSIANAYNAQRETIQSFPNQLHKYLSAMISIYIYIYTKASEIIKELVKVTAYGIMVDSSQLKLIGLI